MGDTSRFISFGYYSDSYFICSCDNGSFFDSSYIRIKRQLLNISLFCRQIFKKEFYFAEIMKAIVDAILNKIFLLRNKIFDRDDFNWSRYHKNYENQIKDVEKDYTLRLSDSDFKITPRGLVVGSPSVHENHSLLYKIIYDLDPKSILEVGCGNGDHLTNLRKIMPSKDVKLAGCDLLKGQLDFLVRRNPDLVKTSKIFVHDITVSPPIKFLTTDKPDLVYTQTVIMHIQKKRNHIKALRNLFYTSRKYIVLMENWTRHNFFEDIIKISKEKNFPWEELYVYKVDSGKQVALVLSRVPLMGRPIIYAPLRGNAELLKYLS